MDERRFTLLFCPWTESKSCLFDNRTGLPLKTPRKIPLRLDQVTLALASEKTRGVPGSLAYARITERCDVDAEERGWWILPALSTLYYNTVSPMKLTTEVNCLCFFVLGLALRKFGNNDGFRMVVNERSSMDDFISGRDRTLGGFQRVVKSRGDLEPGDAFMFGCRGGDFPYHVGFYLGDGMTLEKRGMVKELSVRRWEDMDEEYQREGDIVVLNLESLEGYLMSPLCKIDE